MALQTLGGGFIYHPKLSLDISGGFSTAVFQINAAGEAVAMIRRAEATNTIRRVGFYVSAFSTEGDIDVRLETVDPANGEPTGTLLDASSHHTALTISSTGWKWADFGGGNGAPVTIGDTFAVVFQDNASSAPDITIRYSASELVKNSAFPYSALNIASSWSKFAARSAHALALDTSGDATGIIPGVQRFPYTSLATTDFNNSSDPDEQGIIFQFPFACRVVGGWMAGDLDGDCEMVLYDTNGTSVLATVSHDKDITGQTSLTQMTHTFMFPSAHVLTKDSNYRLTMKPTTATDIDIHQFTVDSAGILDSWDGGSVIHKTSKKDAGWTEAPTIRPFMGLIIDQLDDGVGGGGGGGLKLTGSGGLAG